MTGNNTCKNGYSVYRRFLEEVFDIKAKTLPGSLNTKLTCFLCKLISPRLFQSNRLILHRLPASLCLDSSQMRQETEGTAEEGSNREKQKNSAISDQVCSNTDDISRDVVQKRGNPVLFLLE